MDEPSLVEMRNIEKWYGHVHALKGIDFTINDREVVGLVGDNGAGKSTLIKILCGVHMPDRGEIFFKGKRTFFNSPKDAIKMGIEAIHQSTGLVDSMDIMRNVYLGREPKRRIGPLRVLDLKKMAKDSIVALEKIGLELKSPSIVVNELSGGQRQGVAIARAIYFKTNLLLLDEPTNNLSVKETEKVLEYVKELKNEGTSSVFITHNLYHVYPIADRIVILKLGEKIGEFKKEETSIKELINLVKT